MGGGIAAIIALVAYAGVSIASAALTFNGTSITGDSNSVIDATGTISIGASSATGITIGRTGATTTFPGSISITGTCVGCFTAGGDLSGIATSQTVAGIRGVSVSSTLPTLNQVLQYNGSLWVPATLSINGSTVSINTVATSSYVFSSTANQITIATTTTPGVFVWSLPSNLSISNATATGNLTVQGTTTLQSSLSQSGGLVSLASTTINGNATTTGNLVVLGSLFDANGNKYATSSGAQVPSVTNLLTGNGSGGVSDSGIASSTVPHWVKYTIPYTSLTAASTTQTITLFTLPAQGKFQGITVKHSTSFTGSGLTAMTLTIGGAGGPTDFMNGFDVFQPVGSTAYMDNGGNTSGITMAAQNVTATFTSTGMNLGNGSVTNLTAGSVNIWVLWSVLP